MEVGLSCRNRLVSQTNHRTRVIVAYLDGGSLDSERAGNDFVGSEVLFSQQEVALADVGSASPGYHSRRQQVQVSVEGSWSPTCPV